MNLIISGWPGVGETTLAMLLAKTLNFKLIQGSKTFRLLGERLNFGETGEGRIEADLLLEPVWGPIFDKYIKSILANQDKLIVESDLSGFFTKGNPKIVSVFLYANNAARIKRLVVDQRDNDVGALEARDKVLENKYKEIFNVEFYSIDAIKDNYTIAIDNSNLKIAEELKIVYNKLREKAILSEEECDKLCNNAEAEEANYWKMGKEWYLDDLRKNNNLPDAATIIQEIRNMFKEEIEKFPQKLKDAVYQ
jgi:cytidylate kinase